MEEELRIFKLKIAYRFENAQIPKDFTFPRVQDPNDSIEDLKIKREEIEKQLN